MQTLLLVIVIFGLLTQRSLAQLLLVEDCGTANSTRPDPGAAAWMAAVYWGDRLVCVGTVIHRRFVLTSASCASRRGDLIVKLGAHDLRKPLIEFSVAKKIVHDEYDWRNGNNDIGLLQLARWNSFGRMVYPICIALNRELRTEIGNASTFYAYGWGETKDGLTSNLLQNVTLDRYDKSMCSNLSTTPITPSEICAGASVGGKCWRNSGGPLTKKIVENGLQRQTQLGVISRGSWKCDGLGIYTDVTIYAQWIVRNVWGSSSQWERI